MLTTTPDNGRLRWTRNPSPARVGYETWKRLLDVLLSACALVAFAPFLVTVAIAIRIDSSGPVIFRQARVGLNGKLFILFKFRTMIEGADETVHREAIRGLWAGERLSDDPDTPFKLTVDTRVTGVGRWLRRTSIDELPQLINVLRGEMSLVGPRPMIPYELDYLQGFQHERHTVRPGMTGLWQVTGRGRAAADEMLRLDIEYLRTSNIWTDLKLLMLTLPAIIKGVGAR